MTNEELVLKIQAGEREYILELWEQVKRLAWVRARRVIFAADGKSGVDVEDLMQAAFIALLDAVEWHEVGAGNSFSTSYILFLKNAFAETTEYRPTRPQKDPLTNAKSMDESLSEDGDDSFTLHDILHDKEAEEAFERDIVRLEVARALEQLEPQERQVIEKLYFYEITLNKEEQSTKERALRKLRRQKNLNRLNGLL